MSFSYPTTPLNLPDPAGSFSLPYIAPPHLQPLSEVSDLRSQDANVNNLGFTTLDDWFGQGTLESRTDENSNIFGELDLQDFWMKVGPGEVMSFTSIPPN